MVYGCLLSAWRYVWVSPNTCLGLLVGLMGLVSGGKCEIHRGCLEFYGGMVTWMLKNIPNGTGVLAMTLGHVIIGQTSEGLSLARDHEQVHVRQYQRWGPLFIPLYLWLSVYMWLQNKDAYRDNPFEVEAYRIADPHAPQKNIDDSDGT